MSRNIPQMRRWCVRFWLKQIMLAEFIVDAPNKQFAKWAARGEFMLHGPLDRFIARDRVTVSLVRS
jgi:hypothetical protein